MVDERRKFERVPMRIEAEVKFSSWQVYSLIYTINISKGGMSLELTDEAARGSTLTVKLTPPDGPSMLIDAVVRHSAKTGARWTTGVEFQNLDAAMQGVIERAIRAHGVTLGSTMTARK